MPIGRRSPRGTLRWYLVHAPEREQVTCDKLRKIVPKELLEDAFVPKREIVVKMRGTWRTFVKPLYKDYFFVATRDAAALDKALSKLSFQARIATGDSGHYAPIAREAQEFFEQVMDATRTIRTSTGIIVCCAGSSATSAGGRTARAPRSRWRTSFGCSATAMGACGKTGRRIVGGRPRILHIAPCGRVDAAPILLASRIWR